MPPNHQIAYHLQDALNLLPDLADAELTQSFAATTNDEMLVVYMSSLLRSVIALHALVDNKASIGRAELEESKGEKDREAAQVLVITTAIVMLKREIDRRRMQQIAAMSAGAGA